MKNSIKLIGGLVCGLLCCCLPCFGAEDVTVSVGGETIIAGEPYLIGDTTYVPFDEFVEAVLGGEAECETGDVWATIDGRAVYFEKGALEIDGELCVPARAVADLLGADVGWDGETNSVEITPPDEEFAAGDNFYDRDDLDLLARLIYAESGAEKLLGQCAVGSVVMNRVASDEFPDSVFGVVWDRKYGVQFTPTSNGMINKTPSELSVIAAKLTLEGMRVSEEILYFFEPGAAASAWIQSTRAYVASIGCHDFYA